MDKLMMWADFDKKRTLADKVERAVKYYAEKYGASPNLCYVNPAAYDEQANRVGAVRLVGSRTVLVNHFWIGVEES